MTAKEEAKELVEKFQWKGDVARMSLDNSKQSALICVDEKIADALIYGDVNSAEGHLKEVKQEINKL